MFVSHAWWLKAPSECLHLLECSDLVTGWDVGMKSQCCNPGPQLATWAPMCKTDLAALCFHLNSISLISICIFALHTVLSGRCWCDLLPPYCATCVWCMPGIPTCSGPVTTPMYDSLVTFNYPRPSYCSDTCSLQGLNEWVLWYMCKNGDSAG